MIKRHLAWVVAATIASGLAYANDSKPINTDAATVVAKTESTPAEVDSRISWQTFRATPLNNANPGNNQARIVFLRSGPTQATATPADVYVNGRFHSAVLPGAYAEVLVCAGQHKIELQSRATAGIDPAKVLWRTNYTHPIFDRAALAAQHHLPSINAESRDQRVFFCGSYFRYGFHEDALASAVQCTHAVCGEDPWT
jgi:hypothetical protein